VQSADCLRQQVVVPLQYVELRTTDHPMWSFNGKRVTCDMHLRLLIDLLCLIERCCEERLLAVVTVQQPYL
jgi:hypothetical protein